MSIATVADLVDALRGSQLLDSVHWEEFTLNLTKEPEDPRVVAQRLVQRGWLTTYQVEQLLHHGGQDLTLGPYRLLERLGQGGMGQVYKALHQRLQRIVALKIIREERLLRDADAIERFHREAQAAAQLAHPNIVLIYDADQVGDTHYIAMEYVEGIDLSKLVKQSGPLPVAVAADYIRQATLGLQHAFECGLVHRDIKPSNLLVTTAKPPKGLSGFYRRPSVPGGKPAPKETPGSGSPSSFPGAVVKILDLGLARRIISPENGEGQTSLTEVGTVLGTPDFISPEQARNAHHVDIRADLYSLGCTFYYLLTGRPPFLEGSTIEKLLKHQLDQPPPVEELRRQVPADMALIVAKLMAKNPDQRYQTPEEVTAALNAVALSDSALRQLRSATGEGTGPTIHTSVPVDVLPTVMTGERAVGTVLAEENQQQVAAPPTAEVARPEAPLDPLAVLAGHKGSVMALAFADHGGLLASGGVDGTVRLWDLSGNQPHEIGVLEGHQGDVSALAFAPTKHLLLASGAGDLEGLVCLWELTGSSPRGWAVLRGHNSSVNALAFAPDGRTLALGCNDKSVRLWDVSREEPREQNCFRGHGSYVKTVAFAPDSKTVASGCEDGSVRLWRRGRLWSTTLAVLPVHLGPVHSVAIAPSGQLLATGSMDRTVWLGDLSGDKPKDRALLQGHLDMVRLVAFAPDSKTLFSVGSGVRVILWEVATGAKLREWQLYRSLVTSVALSRDGRRLALGNNDGTVALFRLNLPTTPA